MRRLSWLCVGLLLVAGLVVTFPEWTSPALATSSTQSYVPITPVRLLDSRQAGQKSFSHDEVRDLLVAGNSAVPGTAVAVALNVTVTNPSGDGFLTVWPKGGTRPEASNLNFVSNETVPNLVTIGVGVTGRISISGFLYGGAGSLHVIVDVVGWYLSGFNPITPTRIMDTRNSLNGPVLGPGESRQLRIEGTPGLPNSNVGAVALNVTVVAPTSDGGFLTIWPSGESMPTASSLNFQRNETAANAVIVGVGSDGSVSIFNFSGNSHVIVDVAGWFDQGFDPMTPFRIADTRNMSRYPKLGPGQTMEIMMVGSGEIPSQNVGAVSLNITVTGGTEPSFLTVWPSGRSRPTASSLNFEAGQTIPNAVVSGVGNGSVSIYNAFGDVDVIVDVTGWYVLSDTNAPVLSAMDLEPASVDTTSGPRSITVTARLLDDLAGMGDGQLSFEARFVSPSGDQFVDAAFYERWLGSAQDSWYRGTMNIPRFAEQGVWVIERLSITDQVGNRRSYTRQEIDALGFPSSFTQSGAGDTEAPNLLALGISPVSVDTSSASRAITVSARVVDDLAGMVDGRLSFEVRFRSPSGNQFVDMPFSSRTSGSAVDSQYLGTMTVPRFAESGTWTVEYLRISDQLSNSRSYNATSLGNLGFPTSFVQSGAGDMGAPTLVAFAMSPTSVNASLGSQSIAVTARVVDDLSGMVDGRLAFEARFRSPSGNQLVDMPFYQRSSGTPTDSTYSGSMTVPQFSESGTWQVEYLRISDQLGNSRIYSAAQLAALGFPTSFVNN